MKKIHLFWLLPAIVIFTSCGQPHAKVTIAASKNLWNSIPLIALDKGYFAEEGLDVTTNYLDAGRFCMDAVLSRSADFGNVVDVNIGYLGYSKNSNVVLINEISGCLASDIVARPSRGIHTPLDLKGKALALSPGTTSDIFARRFLRKYGISIDSVKLVKIQPKGMVPGMAAADGPDASSTWEPFVSSMRKALGSDVITFEAPDIYTAREFTAVRADWAKENRAVISAYQRALKKAYDFSQSHIEEAQQIVARLTGLTPDVVKASWLPYQITFTYDKAKYLREITQIGNDIKEQEEYKAQPLPDYAKFLDDSYIKDVK
jgi:NitT/TauT family transport system substrate-binding protein